MNKLIGWHRKLNNGFLHEKIVVVSLLFLLVVLGLDCLFQNLPISGYGLILITLILIGCTTCATCHGIKCALHSNKPLGFEIFNKSQNEKWPEILIKYENEIFKKIFNKDNDCFNGFKYPTGLNEQTRLLLKDIERDFVKTWYSEISQNTSFLFDSHLILEEIFFKIIKKLKTVNCKNLILTILILYLNHLQEYKKSVKKMVRLSNNDDDGSKPKTELLDLCRYSHPGSQSDQIFNYYLKKLTKAILKEYAPHEFANSLQCKILTGIIGRKVFRRLLMTIEDPNWINIKLIYLLNAQKHEQLLGNKIYSVKEKTVKEDDCEFQYTGKPALLSKRYLSSDIYDSSRNLFDRNGFKNENPGSKVTEDGNSPVKVEKESLTLPCYDGKAEDGKGNISTVLSGLIPSTAGPLLPDDISVRSQALNKMWQSPSAESKKEISDSLTTSFRNVFLNEKKGLLTRSKSTESLAIPEVIGTFKSRDVSIGEELCESIRFGSPSDISPPRKQVKKLTKTRSFDNDSLIVENVTDEMGTNSLEEPASSEHPRVVSPVYEEPEDFATIIAKLRSLLQQRESNSTTSDKSTASDDSQSVGFSLERSDSNNKLQSTETDSFDSQIACDIPTDGRLFVNISIPKGELITDSGISPFVLYYIQYDRIYMLKNEPSTSSSSSPELVLHGTVVKRRFQEFLHLQARLEENSAYKSIMKGPSKCVKLPFGGKSEDSPNHSRRLVLESFLRQVCSKVELSSSPELNEFLGYGNSGCDDFAKKDPSEVSQQRIDKLLANKVTGVFNSIKTVLPSFDFDSTAVVATNDTVKGFQEQKLLQGFFNFGSKPECFELHLNFVIREHTGDSLTNDIRQYFSGKSDCIEDAVDVLDSSNWLSEQRECRFISDEVCVWHKFKDVFIEDDLEPPDSWLPVYSLILDIICELLQDSDSWAIKEPVVRLVKVISGHWESRVEDELSKLDWDRIIENIIRLLRGVIFHTETGENANLEEKETKTVLKEVILNLMPGWMTEFVNPDGVSSAVSLFVDSFQHFRVNRDVLLRLLDILLVNLLSCHHLISDSTQTR